MKKYVPICITLGLLTFAVVYLSTHKEQLSILEQLQWIDILSIFLLMFGFFFITGYTFQLLVSLMTVRLSLIEMLGLSFMTTLGNYLGPVRPGTVIKAIYLNSIKELSYTHYTAIFAANAFIVSFMIGLTGILLLLLKSGDTTPLILWFLCLGLIGGSLLPFVVTIPVISMKGKIVDLLKSTIEGFSIIRARKIKLVMICLTIVGQFILVGITTQVLYHALHVPLSLLDAMILAVFTSMSNLFTITPNNIGIQEAVVGYLFLVIGLDFTTGVIGAGVARVIHMAITFLITPLFMYFLLRNSGATFSNLSNS
jgi:uncharacterized membrane protein YbhN (UPF0104 family)